MAIIKTLKESKILAKGRPRQTIYPVTSSDAVIVPNKGKLTTVLSKVAFSNDYNDLDNLPANISTFNNDVGYLTSFTETDPTVPLWAKQNTKPSYNYSEILNTPILATVATSGNYNDLINKPTIPTVPTNVSAFTNDVGYLTQHQSLADYYTKTEVDTVLGEKVNSADLASVATSGSYNDLSNKPTIPTVPSNVSAFNNDAGYLTSYKETDPTVPIHVKGITQQNITNWNNKADSSDLANYYTKSEVNSALNDKQDTITDLATIRSGATLGATAYQKPNGGIPKSDLASSVQTSLGLADSALQQHQDLSSLADGAEYDSSAKKIYLKHGNTRLGNPIDATEFIKDGMIDTVTVTNGNLVISFNTDAGKQPISLPISGIFNANNYYTKTEIDNKGFLTSETDPVFSASVASGITSANIASWNAKQSAIADLEDIRTGASLGATALQSFTETDPTVPSWAKNPNKPTYTASEVGALPSTTQIPSKTSDLTNDSGFITGFTETDPVFTASVAHGITSSDIANWNSKTSNVGTITGITMNGASKGTSGVVDLGTVITEHQDISGKVDKETGKGLSSNDYTNAEKTKLSGIATGAEVNVQSDWNQTTTTADDYIKNKPSLATVATSGSYSDLSNKPTIPTVNNATLTIQKNGTTVVTFTANASSNVTANISVPTKVSDLTNDSGFITGYTETDPTVPSWAKASTKPSYTASEVGALPSTTVIPDELADLTDDATHRLVTDTEKSTWSAKQDALTAGNGIAIDNSDTIRTIGIPYGVVDSTSTSKVFTATVPGIDRLENGVCVMLKNGVVTSAAGFTININGLGAKPAFNNMTAATRETTIFNINYTMLFVYDATRVVDSITGAWVCYRGYDANTNTIGYQLRTNSTIMTVTDTARYYKIYFTSADGAHWVPASVNSTNNATSARAVNQRPINPFGRIVFTSANSNYAAGANLAAATIWDQYTLILGYSFNRTGAALTLTTNTPVYVKCAPQTNGSAIMDADTPIVQALPTTNDGKIYIFLGVAYSATAIELVPNHPVYYHDGTGIKLWTGSTGGGADLTNYYTKTEVDTALSGKQATLVSGTNIKTFNGVSLLGSGNITKPTYNGGEINYTGTTGNVVTNNTTLNVAIKAIDDAIGNVESLLASI